MKKLLISAAALAAFAHTPAMAQQVDEAQAREDMECLVYVAHLGDMMGNTDPEAAQGMMLGIAYFAGHYEATTGRTLTEGWDPEIVLQVIANPDRFAVTCGTRMQNIGTGLQTLSDEMTRSADTMSGRGK